MRGKHQETLRQIFSDPVSGSIKWRDIEALLDALGAKVTEGRGSRVRFVLNNETLLVHRPHPLPDTKRWAVRAVREFLVNAGVKP